MVYLIIQPDIDLYTLSMYNQILLKPFWGIAGTFFSESYQQWYSESREFISRMIPARLNEFEFLYRGDPNGKRLPVNSIQSVTGFSMSENQETVSLHPG